MELQYFFGRILAAGSMLVVPEFGLGRRRISGCAGRRYERLKKMRVPTTSSNSKGYRPPERKYPRAQPKEAVNAARSFYD
jgi:hypothetical protein